MAGDKKAGKRAASSVEELDGDDQSPATETNADSCREPRRDALPDSSKRMERLKKRRALDKQRHTAEHKNSDVAVPKKPSEGSAASVPSTSLPGFHVDVFRDLASADSTIREAAAEKLVVELREVQGAYENLGRKELDGGVVQLEAEKDDGLEECAPSLRYAIRRLIRGVSSSRECARQGFALGLTVVVRIIPLIKVASLLKLIVELLEVSSSMKGQEARDCLLGRLFAYGSLTRSGRIAAEWISDNNTSLVKDFVSHVVSLAGKKRYLREPAVSLILDLVEKLPVEALKSQVLEAPGVHDCFEKAAEIGDPDVLLLALKLQERLTMDGNALGKLLPYPFSPDKFFTQDHLLYLSPCFKESTFCLPQVHSLWPLVVNMLIPEVASHDEDAFARPMSSKKHKKGRKASSHEETTKNIRCFCEVVIEESFLLSSHDRKHLAFNIILLLLPKLPASCIEIVISHKLVQCLMDILSTQNSLLYNAAQHFVKELTKWAGADDDKRVAIIVSLQKHSTGRFDCITRTQTVKELVAKFNSGPGCLLFVHNLMSLFVDEAALSDEPSDQSQTTDENSEIGSVDDDSPGTAGTMDFLKNWIVDTMPRILKNLKPNSNAKAEAEKEEVKVIEEKFRVQTEIMKFLAVQGLFSASLGTEVTSFELQEKFKWPKAATSSSLCRMCIEQLQSLLEDAQRGDAPHLSSEPEHTDLGSYFMCFLKTLCNIPSVSLYRTLNKEDENAFKKLQAIESKLAQEERNIGPGSEANKLHAMRYLLIQLLLQVLLYPEDFSDAAVELIMCCKKAFPAAAHGDSSEEEDEFDDNGSPELMDVLVDTLLQLLPQASGSTCFAIEQVFRFFCDDITDGGLLQMLRVVKKDLKPARHQAASSDGDEDDDEDLIGLEEKEENDEAESAETGESEEKEASGGQVAETGDSEEENDEADAIGAGGGNNHSDDSEAMASDEAADSEDYDDDTMFRLDSAIVQMFRGRKISGNDNALSQLISFKLRVLSLLEICLQRNPGKSQVLMIYSCLAQAFVNSHTAEGSNQLRERLGGILQKRIFKAKDYPKGDDIQLSTLETLLEKSLKSASRNRLKTVSSMAQASTFWILKLIQSRNFPQSELERVFEIFCHTLVDYFDDKKCRLKSGFLKEIFRRHPWFVPPCFGFLLEKCKSTKSEYRRVDALDLVDCMMKSVIPSSEGVKEKDASNNSKLLKKHLPALCELIQELLSRLPEKQSRRAEVRRFSGRVLRLISVLNLKKSFLKALKPDTYSLCESQLGDLFLPFKALSG